MKVFVRSAIHPDAVALLRANPLLSMPGFIATPHYAGSTEERLQRAATACARETAAALFNEENPEYRYL